MNAPAFDQVDAGEVERLAQQLLEQLRSDFVISIDRECDAQAVASVLSVKTKTLRNWRGLDYGPPSRTVHGVAWYSLRDVAAWIIASGTPRP